ncbi:uncharacterized protein DUF4328 [Jejuia pallidilutea]|jgi:hypothetical protein|uniref:Uncharacterized protein DUF4328 n=1 Tax=Jejuia pallidilutea TaxID=504487 RepID=A0A362WZ17_9FLAO|nr:DUF4328 domain-containing protein [Jejuia pallidilutea]PQV47904.1 uncharacterized protein DUF4328 [Jejuia pallidilutea]
MSELRDNSVRSKHILIIFTVLALIDISQIGFHLYQNNVLEGYENGAYTLELIELLDTVSVALGLLQTLCIVATVVFFIRWFRRAYGNLIRLKVDMEYDESKAVWGYFIPFINWVRPVKTMKEVYLKTQDTLKNYDSNLIVDDNTGFIVLWWVIYIINGIVGNYASKVLDKANTIETFIEANNAYIVADLVDLASITLAIIVIQKVTKLEISLKKVDKSVSVIDQIGMTPY